MEREDPPIERRSEGYVDYDRVADRYQAGRSLTTEVLDRWHDAVRPYLPARTRRVIDVGAGTGIFSIAWRQWADAAVIGVEPSRAMIDTGLRADPSLWFMRATAEDLPLGGGCADVVWISTALHHFGDRSRAAREMARIGRPGSRVLVRGYVPGHTESIWADAFPAADTWQARFPTLHEMEATFTHAGFSLVASTTVLETVDSYASAAAWTRRMRHADSIMTTLSDEEFAAGIDALLSAPTTLSRFGLTLVVFERR